MLRRGRIVVLVVGALLAGSCGQPSQQLADVAPAGEAGESRSGEAAETDGVALSDDADADDADADDADARDDGDSVGDSNFVYGFEPQRFETPYVPPITLPDLSVLGETGSLLKADLGDATGSGTSLSVAGATCAAVGGELIYNGSDEADSFLDVETDGSGEYFDDSSSGGRLEITVNDDGSGEYYDDRLSGGRLAISVNPDGSGEYYDDRSSGGRLEVIVDANGFGTYYDDTSSGGRIEIGFNEDRTRTYFDDTSSGGRIDLTVNPDGSGSYFDDTSSGGSVVIDVDAAGAGTYSDDRGSGDTIELSFTTDLGILDPDIVVVAPEPVLAVADRFPPLAKLGSLKPPCATVIRLDSSVLFDFDSDQLRAQAEPVLDQVANALAETDKTLEVHGHTDAKGDDPYNLGLSQRRAETVQSALAERGVTNDISATGFGESRPVAPNESADGSDNPAGRQQNRRVEIVIPE